ncbi:MAG: oligosaccharide flippase family protein, partial [Butyrivibrio sp.]|nr:oligosaccharide flippase family protein [Butyrivibrio sp.]
MGNNRSKDSNFIKQGTILAAASVLSRIIGLLYRSPMTAIIGDESNGLYSYAFEVYSFALILSSYSMPLAVSKLLSAKFAKKEYRNGFRIFKLALLFAAFAGALMMAVIFFAAPAIERFSGYEGLTLPLRVLAPTIFVAAVAGTVRG